MAAPQAPMEINFDPKTMICFIVMVIIFSVIIVKGRKD